MTILEFLIANILFWAYPFIGLGLAMEEKSKRMEMGKAMYREEAWEYVLRWPIKLIKRKN